MSRPPWPWDAPPPAGEPTEPAQPLATVLPHWLAMRLWQASQCGYPGTLTRRAAIERETQRIKREHPQFFHPDP